MDNIYEFGTDNDAEPAEKADGGMVKKKVQGVLGWQGVVGRETGGWKHSNR